MKKSLMHATAVVLLSTAALVASSPANAAAPRVLPAGDTIYLFGCTVNGSNPPGIGNLADDGTVTEVVPFPSKPDANGYCFFGGAYDPTSGNVFVLDQRRTPTTMWVFDPANSSFAQSATADVSACKPSSLAIDENGTAYALTASNAPIPNSLVTIDLATGTCSAPIGDPFTTSIDAGFGGFGGFTFNPLDNVLYATDYSTGRFISINTSDGSVTDFPNSNIGAGSSYGNVGFDSSGMTWIAYGDYAQSLQSAPWESYTADVVDQGYYNFNGSGLYADGIVLVPGGSQPSPGPDSLPETGVNAEKSSLLAGFAGLLAVTGIALVVVRRRGA